MALNWKDSSVAEKYKGVCVVTGPPARHMIRQAGLLQVERGPLVVLDNACGLGIVTSLLYEMLQEGAKDGLQITCGDISEGMVQGVQHQIDTDKLKGASAQVVDAQV
jgi:ubiquinone/menaquinone biosynthesis C-methylase UbiE